MPLPYYVSPEQMMKDKAEYARKGISRGKAIVTIEYRDGVLLVAENPSTLLHKISEIYDRIAFAGVGKYNEFENLRVAGVRHADVKGYSYSRGDVSAKSLANAYSQALGNIFTQDIKPFEVEVLVVEVGDVSFADSSAIAMWVRWAGAVPQFELRDPSPLLRRVIRTMGLGVKLGVAT